MKKIISTILMLAMILSLAAVLTVSTSAAWDGTSVSTELKGAGTEADPYLIENGADLAFLAQSVNAATATKGAYYKVTEDIDLGGQEWTPIGNHWEKYFDANFDGNGKTIKNFKVTKGQYAAGLFGTACGTIANITLDNVVINFVDDGNEETVDGVTYAGIVVGSVFGNADSKLTVKNCRTTETCSINVEVCNSNGDARKLKTVSAAGIVGGQEYTNDIKGIPLTLQNCVNFADIVAKVTGLADNNNGVAGILGVAREVTVDHCVNFGDITATSLNTKQFFVGGIIGRYQGGGNGCTMSNVITTGNILGHQRNGAFVGVVNADNFAMSNAYSLAEIVKLYDPEFTAGACNPIFGGAPNKKNVTMKNVFLVDNGNPLYNVVDGTPTAPTGTLANYLNEVLRAEAAGELVVYKTKAEVEALEGYQTILAELGLGKTECKHEFKDIILADGSNLNEDGTYTKACGLCGELGEEIFTVVADIPAVKDENGNAVNLIVSDVDKASDAYKVAVGGYADDKVLASLNIVDASGAATITFKAEGVEDGILVYLITYDANGIVDKASAIVENGTVTFDAVPNGSFVVLNTGISPATGDNTLAYVIALIAVLTLAGATVVVAKKRAIAE